MPSPLRQTRPVTLRQTLRRPTSLTTNASFLRVSQRPSSFRSRIRTRTNARLSNKVPSGRLLRTTSVLVQAKSSPKIGGHKRDRVSKCMACSVYALNSSINLLWDDATPHRQRFGHSQQTITTYRLQAKIRSWRSVVTRLPPRPSIVAKTTRNSGQTCASV